MGYSRIYFYKKILDTFKIKDFEDFAKISLGIKIPNPSTSKKIEVLKNKFFNPFIFRENEVFGNWIYAKISTEIFLVMFENFWLKNFCNKTHEVFYI